MKYFTILILFFMLLASESFARQKRVNQVPHGTINNCLTCHTGFGGPRNPFGQEIEAGFLDANGDVVWGPALAALDSDGDGPTNGEELQDPTGDWAIGQADPGDVTLVSNPGDPNSTVGVAIAGYGLPGTFALEQNYPNPFNPTTTISFAVPQYTTVSLRVYNSLGQPIRELVNGELQPGQHRVQWDGKSDAGDIMGSGLYLAQLQSENFTQTIRMLLMR